MLCYFTHTIIGNQKMTKRDTSINLLKEMDFGAKMKMNLLHDSDVKGY